MSRQSAPAPSPPETRREVVTETLHGIDVDDPYRWLEGDDVAVSEWADAQNDHVDAALDDALRDRLRPRFADLVEVADYGPISVREGRYFATVREPGADHARLVVRDAPDGTDRVLVDPNAWAANRDGDRPPRSMAWYVPSHDGERVAVGVTDGGDENYDVRVLSVPDPSDSGVESPEAEGYGPGVEQIASLPDRGRVNAGSLAWTADDEGLVYVATGGAADGAQMDKEIRRFRFADGPDAESVLLEHDDQHVWPRVTVDPDSGLLAVAFSEMVGGTEWYVRVDGDLRPVLTDTDAETSVRFHDGTAFVSTDHGAPRRRLLACSVDRFREGDLSFEECREVLPGGEGILQSVVPTPERLLVHRQRDAHSRLSVHDRDGTHLRDVSLPSYCSVTWISGNRDAPEAFFGLTGFDRPPAVRKLDLADESPGEGDGVGEGGDAPELASAEVDSVDLPVPDDLVVEQRFVDSTDGAEVPVFVCYREEVNVEGPRPTVLYGYGGFRNSITPSFGRFRLPFLADGGAFAAVCARGGYEYGEPWHEAGMLEDKQHTFDDFVAAGEALCESGLTDADHLAVAGGSNGGLSVGAVVTQRPDLWAAAQCAVPLLDMLRFHRFLLGESWTTEYGHPEDPEAFEYLKEYSPYHNVDPDATYPPVYFTTAASDTRVHPSHARKMTARLQHEAEGGPFLLRTKSETGHGVGKPASMVVDEQTDSWAFLYERLDVKVGSDDRGVGGEAAGDPADGA
ncbi:prolyl oligopeptidase family serine peptidase [Halorubrum ezzemoulense]|uniref:prolyl oligopeptidase family serine peptidase n=1 Tax=Halorubrum ezzemoulense TaxID=337243 RepID=UPI00233050FE|nr:prolyl oligopeptidase family serine peptidase [Halorubrum ezzemoulense]MDB2236725.1 prolyl oligopeptidase family serine peptidase [Halorubrum ezzemoulense]MDB2247286.1 prolyl oligopeptidase family serine peptidase [Halorubrum ezzemoulense]MDB9248134.1 prolyl oligopeptidase family serine peptidase [Halorubrum ezzemoulense]MDB9257957.1 prolyl oligopeptidase family serine peptidase [Halorubrum ezzemoulense]MDB9261681.1 prolyl oligopeptidase family serine peptidase [Halorubrum ezzemoulense]